MLQQLSHEHPASDRTIEDSWLSVLGMYTKSKGSFGPLHVMVQNILCCGNLAAL